MTTNAKTGRKSKSPPKKSRKVGRPRAIDSPETFDLLVDTYIDGCKESRSPITLTGMILSLGLSSRESFYEYQKYPEFSDSVKRARLHVENAYETRLCIGSAAAGPIFALKNFGWLDRLPTQLEDLQVEKLKRELDIDNDDSVNPESVTVTVEDASKRQGE